MINKYMNREQMRSRSIIEACFVCAFLIQETLHTITCSVMSKTGTQSNKYLYYPGAVFIKRYLNANITIKFKSFANLVMYPREQSYELQTQI